MTGLVVHVESDGSTSHPGDIFSRSDCAICRPLLARLVHDLANEAAEVDAHDRLARAIAAEPPGEDEAPPETLEELLAWISRRMHEIVALPGGGPDFEGEYHAYYWVRDHLARVLGAEADS